MYMIDEFKDVWLSKDPINKFDPRLKIDEDKDLDVYYLPFDYVNTGAKVALVGITPGSYQLNSANNFAARLFKDGLPTDEILRRVKGQAAFSGEPMRSNLIGLLNNWGVQDKLQIKDCEQLFRDHADLVHNTSLFRYAVFRKNGKPYAGTPNPLKNKLLMTHLMAMFVEEVKMLPDTDFIALGSVPKLVLNKLVSDGILPSERVFTGMPHPSGNNTPEIKYIINGGEGKQPRRMNMVHDHHAGGEHYRKSINKPNLGP